MLDDFFKIGKTDCQLFGELRVLPRSCLRTLIDLRFKSDVRPLIKLHQATRLVAFVNVRIQRWQHVLSGFAEVSRLLDSGGCLAV